MFPCLAKRSERTFAILSTSASVQETFKVRSRVQSNVCNRFYNFRADQQSNIYLNSNQLTQINDDVLGTSRDQAIEKDFVVDITFTIVQTRTKCATYCFMTCNPIRPKINHLQ